MKLVEARKLERYTQQQMADLLGCSRPTYAKMESDIECMTIQDAKRIAEILHVPINDIFFEQDCS